MPPTTAIALTSFTVLISHEVGGLAITVVVPNTVVRRLEQGGFDRFVSGFDGRRAAGRCYHS